MANPIPSAPASTAWVGAGGATATGAVAAVAAGRIALVAGATGLVGREILQGLLADSQVAAVHVLGRRPLPVNHSKLTQHIVDFNQALSALPRVDEAFVALGTTIKVAGSQAAFRAVDFDAVLAVARAARNAGATRLGVVSAMGADAGSRVFYNRVKGEMEEALAQLGFETLVIARPSFLAGDRAALGQPQRAGEKIALTVSRWLAPLIPENYKSIPAAAVASALRRGVAATKGIRALSSGEMRAVATGSTAA
jgi:uncharacterized protein YbjT (DUF2867 family)